MIIAIFGGKIPKQRSKIQIPATRRSWLCTSQIQGRAASGGHGQHFGCWVKSAQQGAFQFNSIHATNEDRLLYAGPRQHGLAHQRQAGISIICYNSSELDVIEVFVFDREYIFEESGLIEHDFVCVADAHVFTDGPNHWRNGRVASPNDPAMTYRGDEQFTNSNLNQKWIGRFVVVPPPRYRNAGGEKELLHA